MAPSWLRYLVELQIVHTSAALPRKLRYTEERGQAAIISSSAKAPHGRMANVDGVIEGRHIQSLALTYPPTCACHSQYQQRSPPFPDKPSASSSGHWPPAPQRSPPALLLEKPTRLPCKFSQDRGVSEALRHLQAGLAISAEMQISRTCGLTVPSTPPRTLDEREHKNTIRLVSFEIQRTMDS